MNASRPARTCLLAPLLLPLLFGACFSGPDEIRFVRYFKPVPPSPPSAAAVAKNPGRAPLFLRSVTLAGHLHDAIAWNRDDVEFGNYEDLRWTENPQRIVERALAEAIFGEREVPKAQREVAIDVEVAAFEHVLAEKPFARVSLSVGIVGGAAQASRVFTFEEPCADDEPDSLARAMGSALAAATAAAADWIANPPADP